MNTPSDYIDDMASIYGNSPFRKAFTDDSLLRDLTVGSGKLHKLYRDQFEYQLEEHFSFRRKLNKYVNDLDDQETPEHGSLQQINSIPIDIVYEIFSHLHPKDLLVLTRTSKTLRHVLRTRQAVGVWRSALDLLYYRGLPRCPDDLTEIHYTSLIFDSHCQFCLASSASEVSYLYRVRCCEDCFKKNFIHGIELERRLPEEIIFYEPQTMFLHHIPQTVDHFPEGSPLKSHFYEPVVNQMLVELQEVMEAKDDGLLAKWCLERREAVSIRVKHAKQCAHYLDSRVFHRSTKPLLDRNWEVILVILMTGLLFVMLGGYERVVPAISSCAMILRH